MQSPVQISFHGLPHSDALDSQVRRRIAKLESYCSSIISARVTVGLAEGRQLQGKLFFVRIDLTLPRGEIVVNRDPPEHQAHQDPYVALRDAYRAARRQLEEYIRINYRQKKRHRENLPHGKVVRILLDNDGGFLKTNDGREIYFNKNSVLNHAFDQIQVGDEVRFVEEMGELGPQASSLEKIGKWGRHEGLFLAENKG